MTAKEVIINLIDKGLISGEEAFELMDAISNKKIEYVPYKEPYIQPYTSPWITWNTSDSSQDNTNESTKHTDTWSTNLTNPPYTITATNNLQKK
jgi:hypothetical protein